MTKYAHLLGLWMLLCIFCLLFINSARANVDPDHQPQSDHSVFDMGGDGTGTSGIRMLASLLLVLALIGIGVFLLKKFTPYKAFSAGTRHPIQILSRVSLGQRRAICLVRIADEILVIGLTNTIVSLLSKMNADEYVNEQDASFYKNSTDHKDSFRKILEKLDMGERRTSMSGKEEV